MEVLRRWVALGTCEMWLSKYDNKLGQPWDLCRMAGVGSMTRRPEGGREGWALSQVVRIKGGGGPGSQGLESGG